MALLLVLALSVVPEGKVASSLLRVSWLCLIASGILTIVRGRRLSAGQRNDSAGRPHDVAPTGVLGAGRGTIGAAVDARALAVARRRARWLHRGTVAIFAVCLFVIAVAPCVALLTGRSLSLAALAAGGAAAMVWRRLSRASALAAMAAGADTCAASRPTPLWARAGPSRPPREKAPPTSPSSRLGLYTWPCNGGPLCAPFRSWRLPKTGCMGDTRRAASIRSTPRGFTRARQCAETTHASAVRGRAK